MYEELANAKILVDANALIAAFVHSGLLDKAKCGEVLELIKRCSAIQKDWIPVSERLPEESLNSVIGWDAYRARPVFVQCINGYFCNIGSNESFDIKAWMPLPEPYKEGRHGLNN